MVNMGNYESFTTGASVELDSETEPFTDFTIEELYAAADKTLAQALAKDLKEAAEVSGIPNTFILTMELQ